MPRLSTAAFACVLAALIPIAAFAKSPGADDAIAATQVLYDRTSIGDISATMVQEGAYIVAWWKAGAEHPAGCALLKKTGGNWAIVKMGNSKLVDAGVLQGLGVPADQAKALVADVNKPGGTTPSP